MGFLRGLGRAMTALGQDLSFTKREDEERQRQAAAETARRTQFEADRTEGRAYREGQAALGREQGLTDLAEGRTYGEGQDAIRREQDLVDIESSQEFQRSMVPEPPSVRGVQVTDEFGNIHFRDPRVLGDTGLNALPRGSNYDFDPNDIRGLGRGGGPGPGGQTITVDEAEYLRSQGMSDEDIAARYNIVR